MQIVRIHVSSNIGTPQSRIQLIVNPGEYYSIQSALKSVGIGTAIKLAKEMEQFEGEKEG